MHENIVDSVGVPVVALFDLVYCDFGSLGGSFFSHMHVKFSW